LDALQLLKVRLANNEAASNAHAAAQHTPNGFDRHALQTLIADHLIFSNLHRVTLDE